MVSEQVRAMALSLARKEVLILVLVEYGLGGEGNF